MRNIRYIVVHCTATSQKATVEGIKNGWKRQGWVNPGYHVLVLPDGTAVELLPDEAIANGVKGFNGTGLHISYIGGISDTGKPIDNRTPQQKTTIRAYLKAWRKKYPKAKIQGHRDFSPDKNGNGRIDPIERIKECPCFDAIPEYADI